MKNVLQVCKKGKDIQHEEKKQGCFPLRVQDRLCMKALMKVKWVLLVVQLV